MKKSPKIDLSVIIVNFNSGNYLANCLKSLKLSTFKNFETIIVDNASTDNSIRLSKKIFIRNTKYLILNTNYGFATSNNRGVKSTNPFSKYILFLNPDTILKKDTLQKMVDFFKQNPRADAATCKIILAKTGQIQPECHRDFPTPLNAFLHFSGISSRAYFMKYLDYSITQQINACVGAFLMVKRKAGETIGWWNEKYFFYGEDLDFCFKLKQKGYLLFYYPKASVVHFQGVSSGIKKTISAATRATRIQSAIASTNAMRIFYQENLFKDYSRLTQLTVLLGIKFLETIRVFKAKYL